MPRGRHTALAVAGVVGHERAERVGGAAAPVFINAVFINAVFINAVFVYGLPGLRR